MYILTEKQRRGIGFHVVGQGTWECPLFFASLFLQAALAAGGEKSTQTTGETSFAEKILPELHIRTHPGPRGGHPPDPVDPDFNIPHPVQPKIA